MRSRLANANALAWPSRLYFRQTADRKIAAYGNRVVGHSFAGHELTIRLEDPVAEDWYDHDWPLTPELECLQGSRLVGGANVFDLGAHQGVVALILSRLVGSEGHVVAVEAERHNFEVAVRNRDLNHATNLEIFHAAAAATSGSLYFRGGLNGAVARGGRFGLTRVPAVNVDGLADSHGAPDVVFIDVEGYENEVLRGAQRTLARGRTDFFVEVHVGYGLESLGGSAQSVIEHFDQAHFRLLVSPAHGELENYSFSDLDPSSPLPAAHFFLVALAEC